MRDPQPFLVGVPRKRLWPHQEYIVAAVLAKLETVQYGTRAAMVCEPAGRGKTFAALEVIRRDAVARVTRGEPRFGQPWLVVCAKILLAQWVAEIERSYDGALMTYDTVCVSSSEDATSAAENLDTERVLFCSDIVITTYDTLRCAAKAIDERGEGAPVRGLLALTFRGVVADEAVVLNNDQTAIFDACAHIRTARHIYMTMTPLKTGEDRELNAIFSFLGATVCATETARAFRAFLVRTMAMTDGPRLPRVVHTPFLRADERATYAALEAQQAREVGGATYLPWLTIMRKMSVSAALLLSPEAYRALPADRAPSTMMACLLTYARTQMAADEKALVFAAWQSTLEEARHFLEGAGHACITLSGRMADRDAAIATFMFAPVSTARFLLLPTTLGAAGLDLWRANHVLFVGGEYRVNTEAQGCGRVREGNPLQTRPCHYYKFVIADTADETVLAHNRSKQQQVTDFYSGGGGSGRTEEAEDDMKEGINQGDSH